MSNNNFILHYVSVFDLQVRNVLDIGCGFGSFGAHLRSLNMMVVCTAAYELTGSQVQVEFNQIIKNTWI